MFDLCFFRPPCLFEAKRVHKQLFGKFLDVNDLRQNISFAVGLFIIIARMLTGIFLAKLCCILQAFQTN